jgi:hypothetical protein
MVLSPLMAIPALLRDKIARLGVVSGSASTYGQTINIKAKLVLVVRGAGKPHPCEGTNMKR